MSIIKLIPVVILLFTPLAFSKSQSSKIPRIKQGIQLDGKLSEVHWQQAAKFEFSNIIEPFENQTAPVTTEAFIYEDQTNLYVGFKANDPNPHSIRGGLRDRDQLFSDDYVSLWLDPQNTRQLAYIFAVNAFGSQYDGIYNEPKDEYDQSWDGIWQSKAQVRDDGYTIELIIPLNNLNFDPSDTDLKWGFKLNRFYPRDFVYEISNIEQDRNKDCLLCLMRQINGFANAEKASRLEIIPTIVQNHNQSRQLSNGEDWQSGNENNYGLTLNWGISSNTDLSATINPDFSQVEADSLELSINRNSAIYYSEKRPFFVKNGDYFDTPWYDLMYSRNIVKPDWGTKITGRNGKHTFAALAARDELTQFLVSGNLGNRRVLLDQKSDNAAIKYQYSVDENWSLGALSTFKRSDDYHNSVASIDSHYRVTESDTFIAQYVTSNTEYDDDLYLEFCDNPELCNPQQYADCALNECEANEYILRTYNRGSFSGKAYRIGWDRYAANHFFYLDRRYQDEDFNAHLGWVSRADIIRNSVGAGLYWFDENSWWSQIRLYSNWYKETNIAGALTQQKLNVYAELFAINDSKLTLARTYKERAGIRIDGTSLALHNNTQYFDEADWLFKLRTNISDTAKLTGEFQVGDKYVFGNNEIGEFNLIALGINWDLTSQLKLNLDHTREKMDAVEGHLYTENITDLRLSWQLDDKQNIRLISSHYHSDTDPDKYRWGFYEKYARLRNQLLYSYKINPLTLIYLGYSDQLRRFDSVNSLKQDKRSVFLKLSYAWQI